MTIFGTTLDGAQLASLGFLLAALVFWVFVLGRERDFSRWANRTEEGQKAKRAAGVSAPAAEPKRPKTGPWG